MTDSTVLVVGDLMIDVVVAMPGEMVRGSDMPSEITTTFGGTAANVATWLAVCGSNVRTLGAVGEDTWGAEMIHHLEQFNIDCHIATTTHAPTGAVVALCHPDGERSFFPDARANSYLGQVQIAEATWQSVSYLYLSGYTLLNPATRTWAVELLREARRRGIKIVLDPASSGPLAGVAAAELDSWLALTDVLVPNDQEFGVINKTLGEVTAPAAICLKHGSEGVTVYDGSTRTDIPAVPAEVVDTVGAGDAFAAGLLHGLNCGHSLADSARLAVTVAAAAVSIRGAQPAPSSTLDIK
jgi:sugar/nucleoside kinase (ribokinase family)